MDADLIRSLEPQLSEFLDRFSDCFARSETRAHFPVYVRGQLSELPRKSVEPIALADGTPVRTLQEFLTHLKWKEDLMRSRLASIVAEEHADEMSIGLIDETGWVKKGDQTPGVQRQYCGSVGKKENCIITVHLGYAAGNFHCLLDGDLFLPESWSDDRERCRHAGIPDDVTYRPKSEIALELYDRATGHGVRFAWLTFDEWYGSKPAFLRALDARKQKFVGEIPKSFPAWIQPPRVTTRRFHRHSSGRPRKTPRLVAGSVTPQSVEQLAQSHPALAAQAWTTWRIKETQKGPLVWHVKHALVHVQDEGGLPEGPRHLLVCYHPLSDEIKYFLSNAPVGTPASQLLRVAFGRWRIERCFEDGKGEVGLDHWEGRGWLGLKRHLILTTVSYLFLAQACQRLREKKSGVDGVPGAFGGQCTDPGMEPRRGVSRTALRENGQTDCVPARSKRDHTGQPRSHHDSEVAKSRHRSRQTAAL